MSRFKAKCFALAFGAATIVAAPTAWAEDGSVQLSADQIRLAAELNLKNRQYDIALAFADALLKRDPQDVSALLIRSHVLRVKTNYGGSQKAARTAWRSAQADTDKYAAALLMAQALSSDDKRTRAQFWLRRAAEVAPTKAHAARAAQDFNYVRLRNPWETNLSFTLQPSSNVNSGSSRDSSSLLYEILTPLLGDSEVVLGASSKALSGLEVGFDLQSRYRFRQTEFTAHDLRMGMSYRTYRLSDSATAALAEEDAARVARGESALNIDGSNFAFGTVQLGYGYKQLRQDHRGEFSFSADIGQTFYGGNRYNRFLRGHLGQSYYLDTKNKLNFGLTANINKGQNSVDQEQLSLSAGLNRRLENGNGLYLGASVGAVRSETERLEYDEVRLRSGYIFGREILKTSLQLGLNTSFRDYDVSPHDASGRRDLQISADVTATFKHIDYMGFNPTVSVTASSTDSNIGLYDVNRFGVSIGIASAF